ncbi:MAG: hypothetical protein ACR2HY_02270 [Acidimicrobiales bacterium]
MRRALVAIGMAAVLVWAGCGGPRNSLNTATSVCFRSLVVAEDAVHHKGRLVGVRKVSAQTFARHVPDAPTVPKDDVCLVAFGGDYRPGDVAGTRAPTTGRYAVVAVTTGQPVLLGARVTDDLPIRFRHRT